MNWRGLFSLGTTESGAASTVPVEWPGFRTTAYHSKGETQASTTNWMGSLLEGQRDAGGHMYMRNRYYDPATGQFTQTDPIGIAGGLNTYGFASGDPVSYSDPYGLRCDPWPECAAGYWEQIATEAFSEGNRAKAAGASLMSALAEVGNFILKDNCGEEVLCAGVPSVRSAAPAATSRAARREAMREQGIPTSRPADRQVRPRQAPSERQYQYDAPSGRTQTVTHHSADAAHPRPHWEAGTAKQPARTDPLGRQRYNSDKSKVEYEP